jgi:hypothetical protein
VAEGHRRFIFSALGPGIWAAFRAKRRKFSGHGMVEIKRMIDVSAESDPGNFLAIPAGGAPKVSQQAGKQLAGAYYLDVLKGA